MFTDSECFSLAFWRSGGQVALPAETVDAPAQEAAGPLRLAEAVLEHRAASREAKGRARDDWTEGRRAAPPRVQMNRVTKGF